MKWVGLLLVNILLCRVQGQVVFHAQHVSVGLSWPKEASVVVRMEVTARQCSQPMWLYFAPVQCSYGVDEDSILDYLAVSLACCHPISKYTQCMVRQ